MKCKATTKTGKPCSQKAIINGYCLTHWNMKNGQSSNNTKRRSEPMITNVWGVVRRK